MKSRRFVDCAHIRVSAGDGGDGCAGFRREKYVPRGGPDGGDGGRGGSVLIRASRDEDSLVRYYFEPEHRAEAGGDGRGKQQHGTDGADLVLPVPCGTEVWDEERAERIADLVADGQEIVAARGGRGGLGNCHFKTPSHQAPTEQTDGVPGEERTLRLELKLIADAGLVGFPNAGKSSLLRALTHARPKVATYAFTTRNPIIGTMDCGDYRAARIVDIPGLVKDAHLGVGLGHEFLRHVERARSLIMVIDMAATEGRVPADDYRTLTRELSLHREGLADRVKLVVANKMDVEGAGERLRAFSKRTGVRPLPVSALTGEGIAALREAVARLVPSE